MSPGRVYLVGAGPGSPDLITLRGLRALGRATWIIADSLLPADYLSELGISAAGRTTWLEPGEARDRHAEILAQMARAAEAGQVVVRLKNGDPFVFGRGYEEIEFLTSRGVAWEAIPGISVCTAGTTLAGLPLTSRTRGRSFAVVTARCSGGTLNRHYPRADTLVIYMGASVLREIADQLIRDGWSGQTPAAVLSRVSMAWENRCSAALETIAALAEDGEITSPAILVVGEAAAQGSELPRRPRILFAGEHPGDYAHLGELTHWPALAAVPLDADRERWLRLFADLRRGRFGWVVFRNPTSVRMLFQRVAEHHRDARLFGRARVVAVGGLTRRLLLEHGLQADLTLDGQGQETLARALESRRGRQVLVCRGFYDPPDVEGAVRAAGGIPRSAILFSRRPHPDLGRPLPAHDVILFTCPSEVAAYAAAYGEQVWNAQLWCVDDATQAEVRTRRHPGPTESALAASRS